jgi:hypothetical protein
MSDPKTHGAHAQASWALACVLLATALAGCGAPPGSRRGAANDSRDAAAIAGVTPDSLIRLKCAAIDSSLAGLKRVSGTLLAPDSLAAYAAWFGPSGLQYIDEQLLTGHGRDVRSRYWFDAGRLIRWHSETSMSSPTAPPGAPGTRLEYDLRFDARGGWIAGEKRIGDRAVPLPAAERALPLAHAESLGRDAARLLRPVS